LDKQSRLIIVIIPILIISQEFESV